MYPFKKVVAGTLGSSRQSSLWHMIPLFAALQFAFLQFSVTGKWSRILPLQAHAFPVLVVNIALISLGILLAFVLFNRFWAAAFLAACITSLIVIANQVKISLLGAAIEPSADLGRIHDVRPFIGGILFNRRTLVWFLLVLVCGCAAFYLNRRIPLGRWDNRTRFRIGLLVLGILAAFPALAPWLPRFHLYGQAKSDWMFSCTQDGVPLTYMANLDDFGPRHATRPPTGYGPDRIKAITDNILRDYQPVVASNRPPDIVMIAQKR